MPKRRRVILVVILLLAIGNYSRIIGNENIRLIQFLSIFVIGLLSGLLLSEGLASMREKKQ